MIKGQQPAVKSGLPFRRKILYYGLMLALTLLAIEGIARLAYYAAYGTGYGGGAAADPDNLTPSPISDAPHDSPEYFEPLRIAHPFYGLTAGSPRNVLNAMPPRPRREDTVIIGLLGGSVAEQVKPYFQEALNRWFAAKELSRRPAVLGLAMGSFKQPQQTLIVTNTLLLGGEFDLIVNLDGFNELRGGAAWVGGFDRSVNLDRFNELNRSSMTGAELLLVGRLRALRGEQARRLRDKATSPLRGSALFGLANRYQQERTAAEIIRLNHQLAAPEPDASPQQPERRRQRNAQRRQEWLQESARFWYRSSVMLARLAQLAGADYYHFLQPNQYVPDSKPLSPWEREFARVAGAQRLVEPGYPLLREFNQDLQNQGINYFDLTQIFADYRETLYIDDCCHLNKRGNELLAAEMVRRMAPALVRRGGERPAGLVSVLAAARRPAESVPPRVPPVPPARHEFQVSLQGEGKVLRYGREDCAREDTGPWFFLHLIPRDLQDLPRRDREKGFANQDFRFWKKGGRFEGRRCAVQIPLPDYPIAALRTGQHIPGQVPLWSVDLIVPADPDQLRDDYAALAAAEPAVRDYFDLYVLDSRLLYLRETCTATDTAANFFLHIVPEDVADLPGDRREAGFVHAGFAFDQQGSRFDGKCLAAVALPDYPLKEIRTGQHIPGQGDMWSVELIAAPDYDQLRADYAALAATTPAARDYFDLYRRDNRLLYVRETCAAADTAANFFLHIVPEDVSDLPADRRDAGFAHGGFAFVRRGGHFDGKCLAAVALPDYPGGIKEMRTGQFVPGQGDLWSATIAAP